jgi:hypothetical protein
MTGSDNRQIRRDRVESVRQAVAEMRKLRTELAERGVQLAKILQSGESLRDLAHARHRP